MLFVVSPAKNLDYKTPAPVQNFSVPELLEQSQILVDICKELTPQALASLMKISDKLAALNAVRFQTWQTPFTQENAKQALFAFNGDVYTGLDADSLSKKAIERSQQQMRILSGLYGLLKPLDLMQAYRLEMGTRLSNLRGKNLYEFWGDIITEQLNQALAESNSQVLIQLASNEYYKAVNEKLLQVPVVTPVFKDTKNGQLKIISFYAKKARGLMARFILEKEPQTLDDLKAFDSAGYEFSAAESNQSQLVFHRAEQF